MSGKPIGENFARIDKIVSQGIDSISDLTHGEADFISGLADRLDRYGEKTLLSDRQTAWLDMIAVKLDRMGAE